MMNQITDLVEYFATSPAASLAMEMVDLAERRLVLLGDSLAVSPSAILRKVGLVRPEVVEALSSVEELLWPSGLSRQGRGGVRESQC